MRKATKPLLALVLFGAVAGIGYAVVWPALRSDQAARIGPRAEKGLGLPPGFIRRIERADPVEAAGLLRAGLEEYSGVARKELLDLIARRAKETLRATETEVGRLLDGYRYATAVAMLERVRRSSLSLSLLRRGVKNLDMTMPSSKSR